MFKKMRSLNRALALTGLFILFSGCTNSEPPPAAAKEIADKFYQALIQQDFDTALGFYSPKRSIEEWQSALEKAQKNLGNVVSYSFRREEINTVLRGRFFIFEYQVKYSGGKTAAETMTLFHKVDEEGIFIVSHVIAAQGFSSHP